MSPDTFVTYLPGRSGCWPVEMQARLAFTSAIGIEGQNDSNREQSDERSVYDRSALSGLLS